MFQLELLKSDFFKPETFIFFSFLQQQHCFVHLSETKQTDSPPFCGCSCALIAGQTGITGLSGIEDREKNS